MPIGIDTSSASRMNVFPLSPARYRRRLSREVRQGVLARQLRRVGFVASLTPFTLGHAAVDRGAMQQRTELGQLLHLLRGIPLRVVVEIGSAYGGTMYAWCRAASSGALIVSIDLQGGAFGGGNNEDGIAKLRGYARAGQRVHSVCGDSHAPETFENLQAILGGRAIDFLMIDGDHSYGGVRSDFEDFRPLVRSGGLIAFHDIVPGPPEYVGGVPEFWQKVKYGYVHKELVESWEQGGWGIGVLRIP